MVAVSSVYETEPMYLEDQGWFLNAVAVVETDEEPLDLLARLNRIEARMGRVRGRAKNAPRTIDLDILFYGDLVATGPTIQIPHPRLTERAFVLVPLAEVRPSLVHPVLGKTAAALMEEVGTGRRVFKTRGVFPPSRGRPPRPGRPGPSRARRESGSGTPRSRRPKR